jgi:hypothetical protein
MHDHEAMELGDMSFEDFEDFEDMEDFESFENYEDYEDFEEMEDFEDLEGVLDPEEFEGDLFIGSALRKIRKGIPKLLSNPLLKKAVNMGAGALGQAIGGSAGRSLATTLAGQAMREADYEGDYEGDFEGDFEADFEAAGGDLEALYEMQYYADRAARAQSAEEADQFLPIVASLAGKLLPKALPFVKKGIGALGRLFSRRRRTRPLMSTLPRVAAQAAMNMGQGPVTPRRAVGALSQSLAQTLANRQRAAAAMRHRPMMHPGMSYGGAGMLGEMPMRPGYSRYAGPAAGPRYGSRPGYGMRLPNGMRLRRIRVPVYVAVR